MLADHTRLYHAVKRIGWHFMVVYAIEITLAVLIVLGSLTMVWGVRRFKLPAAIMTIAFAITAVSWVAFLIATISVTVRTLMLLSM